MSLLSCWLLCFMKMSEFKRFFGITVAWRSPSGPQVLMDLHGGFKKWSIWIGAETKMSLLPCWLYVCTVIVWISRLLRGGQANVGNILNHPQIGSWTYSSRVNLGKGGSQVTAPSVGCDKYVCLKHNFSSLPQYSASNRNQWQDLQISVTWSLSYQFLERRDTGSSLGIIASWWDVASPWDVPALQAMSEFFHSLLESQSAQCVWHNSVEPSWRNLARSCLEACKDTESTERKLPT